MFNRQMKSEHQGQKLIKSISNMRLAFTSIVSQAYRRLRIKSQRPEKTCAALRFGESAIM